MEKITAKKMTVEGFAPYGSFSNIVNPSGCHMEDFYNDQVRFASSGDRLIGFSPLVVHKKEKMIVSEVEYHNTTEEGIVIMDDDVILHVAPPSKEPVPEQTEAFLVPAGTVVKLNLGVWHMGVIPVTKNEAHVLIILPERVYKNDCQVVQYAEEDKIEIVL